MRYTEYHAGKAVIKDKNKLSEAMEKLARLEDAEEKDRLGSGFHAVRRCRKMKATYWYHLKTTQCRISRDMKKMTRAVRSIREMKRKPMQVMD